MNVLIYLIPIALLLGLLGLAAFLWALRNGQFDDLDGAAERVLFDDEETQKNAAVGEAQPHQGELGKDRATAYPD